MIICNPMNSAYSNSDWKCTWFVRNTNKSPGTCDLVDLSMIRLPYLWTIQTRLFGWADNTVEDSLHNIYFESIWKCVNLFSVYSVCSVYMWFNVVFWNITIMNLNNEHACICVEPILRLFLCAMIVQFQNWLHMYWNWNTYRVDILFYDLVLFIIHTIYFVVEHDLVIESINFHLPNGSLSILQYVGWQAYFTN